MLAGFGEQSSAPFAALDLVVDLRAAFGATAILKLKDKLCARAAFHGDGDSSSSANDQQGVQCREENQGAQ
jgi:hypothetical protein